jgi:hypothetical protein
MRGKARKSWPTAVVEGDGDCDADINGEADGVGAGVTAAYIGKTGAAR